MARREVGSRRWWCAALAAGLGLLVAPRAAANVGVPMLAVLWPVAVVAFVPVVAVEAVVARRVIGGGWGAAWKVSLLANLATTIAGVPVTWLVMLLVQLVVSLIGAGLELGPEWSWIGTPFVLAWIPPHVVAGRVAEAVERGAAGCVVEGVGEEEGVEVRPGVAAGATVLREPVALRPGVLALVAAGAAAGLGVARVPVEVEDGAWVGGVLVGKLEDLPGEVGGVGDPLVVVDDLVERGAEGWSSPCRSGRGGIRPRPAL